VPLDTRCGRAAGAKAQQSTSASYCIAQDVLAVLVYVATQGRVPIVLGVDLDGGGPFESLGYRSMAVLIGLFVIVCLLEVVAAR
jgi:hypothetical protein